MLAIEQMSRMEKLRLMESLWEDLSHEDAALASPGWHGEALTEAERALAAGDAHFVDWEQAKRALRDSPV